MAKKKIQYCNRCGEYTRHIYIGKLKEAEDPAFNRIATVMTLGGYQIAKRLMDESPKCFECTQCGLISKKR